MSRVWDGRRPERPPTTVSRDEDPTIPAPSPYAHWLNPRPPALSFVALKGNYTPPNACLFSQGEGPSREIQNSNVWYVGAKAATREARQA